jgi:NADPH-ferrihemoprotein reductase
VVFWGSQGGTAEALASRYASELCDRLAISATAEDLADYDHIHLEQINSRSLIVFILATYGDGDFTDNAHGLFADLQAAAARNSSLQNMRYAIFGLGNSNYRLYNKAVVEVDRLLVSMGAIRLGVMGCGDDRLGTTDEDFISWKQDTNETIAEVFALQQVTEVYRPRFEMHHVPGLRDASLSAYTGGPYGSDHKAHGLSSINSPEDFLILSLQYSTELITQTQHSSRHCLHLEFSLANLPIKYETGDYLHMWRMNPEQEVKSLLTILGLWNTRKEVFRIIPSSYAGSSRTTFPSTTTLENLFRHCLEICGPVSRDVMSGLAQFIEDTVCRQRFQAIVEDPDAFRQRISSRRLTLATALEEIIGDKTTSIPVPVTYLLKTIRRLSPRSYSISSSALAEPRKVAITVSAASEEHGVPPSTFHGVTSHYLLQLHREHRREKPDMTTPFYLTAGPGNVLQGCKVFAQIQRSGFRLPPEPTTPILMVGAGTGVAPFRAFVQERMTLKAQGKEVGKIVLMVGHRSPTEDFYYQQLWQEASACLGGCFELHTAFSRVGDKVHVQDVLRKNAELVLSMLSPEAVSRMYICGSTTMAQGVNTTLKELWCSQCPQPDEAAADQWITKLLDLKRLQEDSWG